MSNVSESLLKKAIADLGVVTKDLQVLQKSLAEPVPKPLNKKKSVPLTPADVALFAYHHKMKNGKLQMTYTEDMNLRMIGVQKKMYLPKLPPYADCSSFTTWCYFAAHWRDPNNAGYDGVGYGELQWYNPYSHLVEQGQRECDIVFYGSGVNAIEHVALLVNSKEVVSFGSEGAPYLLPYRYRTDIVGIRRYPC